MAGPNVMVGDDISVLAGNLITNDLNGNLTVAGNLTVNGTLTATIDTDDAFLTGNLTFTGVEASSGHIIADMSNSDWNKRLTFVNRVTNAGSFIEVTPNGTSVTCGINFENSSTIGNNALIAMSINNIRGIVNTGIRGTGTPLPLYFAAGAGNVVPLGIQSNGKDVFAGITGGVVSSTQGWFQIATSAGTPTGLPTLVAANYAAITVDTSNNKLYFYANSAWQSVVTNTSGTATLVAGTVTVNTAVVYSTSIILISRNTPSGVVGTLSAPSASIVDGVSFVINSDSITDVSTVNWLIVG